MARVISGTGHRPNKLGGYSDQVFEDLVLLAKDYLRQDPAVTAVISGMALGWDQALAQAALDLGLPVHAAIPHDGQEGKWPQKSQDQFHRILQRCRSMTVVSPGAYAAWKMQARNEWMVDRSHVVLALWDGSPGGTGNCMAYVQKRRREVINLWPQWVGGGIA